jgi:hypothetical protein
MCRQLGMSKLASQRHNLKDPRPSALLKANDFSVILCDACAHTFIASPDECQPTHAAAAYLSSRGVSKLPHITRQRVHTSSKAARLQVSSGAFDEDAEDDPAGGSSGESDACAAVPRPSSPADSERGRGSGLSEAAFYMSLGESDAGDCEGRGAAADCSAAAGATLGADDSFDDIDGNEANIMCTVFSNIYSIALAGMLQQAVLLPPPRFDMHCSVHCRWHCCLLLESKIAWI